MKRVLAIALAAAPGWAHAIELDYYTYNGFEETVAAFQRLALVLNNNGFLIFAGMFAVMGVLIGGIMTAANGIQGRQVNPIAFLIPVALGVALFQGMVIRTGTVYVYDPVRNATQAVSDVPDVIVLLAGGLNKIERGVIEIVDTASANLYSEDGGATDFSLVLSAWNARDGNVALERTLVNYYIDCGLPAMSQNLQGSTLAELKRGSTDLFTTFARWNGAALATVYYPGPGDTALTATCAEVWAYVAPQLNDRNTFGQILETTCEQVGFDSSDLAQLARCEAEITNATRLYGVTAANSLPLLRSIVMARSVSDALNSDDFKFQQRQLIDRQIMAEGFGAAEAMNRWVPKLRGFLVATVLGIVPMSLLFVVTPLAGRAMALVGGLFLWLALWGITDAMSVQMATDSAIEAFEQIRRFGLSYDALMNTPEAAVQALGVFGKARTMALMLATMLSYSLFRFGGYAFTSIAQNWQQHLDQAGEAAGRTVFHPEARGAMVQQLAGAVGPQAAVAAAGFSNAAFSAAQGTIRGALESRYINERMEGGGAQPSGVSAHHPSTEPNAIAYPNSSATRIEGSAREPAYREIDGGLAEVTVSSSRHAAGPERKHPTGHWLLENEAQKNAGGRFGTAQSYEERSIAREQSVFDTEKELASHRTTYDVENTYGGRAQRVLAPGGVPGAAQLDGQMAGARTRAFAEVYRNINGTNIITAEGMFEMARQLDGAAIAVSTAGPPDEYIRALREAQVSSMAYGRELEKTGSADMLGTARAHQEIIRGAGFFEALRHAPSYGHMISATAFQDLLTAGRGRAAEEIQDQQGVAYRLGQSGLSKEIAGDNVTRQVADFQGINSTTVGGLVQSEKNRQGAHVSLAVPPAQRDEVLGQLDKQGLSNPKQAAALRNEAGFGLTVDIAGGQPLTATTSAGDRTFVSHTFEDASGSRISRFETEHSDYDRGVAGNLAVRPHLAEELLRAYGGNFVTGERDDKWLYSLGANVGGFLSDRAITQNASDSETLSMNMGLGASVSASGKGAKDISIRPNKGAPRQPTGPGGPGQAPPQATAGGGFEVSGSGGIQRVDADQVTTQLELGRERAVEIIEAQRQQLIGEYERKHGPESAAAADNQESLAEMLAQRVNVEVEKWYAAVREEVSDAAAMNDSAPEVPALPKRK